MDVTFEPAVDQDASLLVNLFVDCVRNRIVVLLAVVCLVLVVFGLGLLDDLGRRLFRDGRLVLLLAFIFLGGGGGRRARSARPF